MVRNYIQHLAVASITVCLTASVFAADGTLSNDLDAASVQQAQKLKLEARLAAERGDFASALDRIAGAADLTGDVRTARKARELSQPFAQAAGGGPNPQEVMQMIVSQTLNAEGDNWAAPWGQGTVGTMEFSYNGVFMGVNALANAIALDHSKTRLQEAAEFAKTANHNRDVRVDSDLRMVSLPRLDQYLRQLVNEGRPIAEDVRTIAGISQIKYLFVFPETGDVVIAGPAGDWQKNSSGQPVSAVTGRPTLNIDDLVTLTRTFTAGGPNGFMCTINPKRNQVAAVQQFVEQNRRGLNAATASRFTSELEQKLGLQDVIVRGVPQQSRVASVIVEADYRMKEIGIGKRQGAAGMKSYFDLLSRSEQRGSTSMDALRWWMAVGYDAINVAANGKVYEFAGNSVQCLSENQIVNNDGTRQSTGKADRANTKFAELFTQHLPELAAQDPIFADLQNIFDLAMVSALVHSQGLAQQVGWSPDAFGNRGGLQTESVEVPTELMTAAAHKVYRGGGIVIQVAGGVRVDARRLLNDSEGLRTVAELGQHAANATPMGQQNNRWWWDAAQR